MPTVPSLPPMDLAEQEPRVSAFPPMDLAEQDNFDVHALPTLNVQVAFLHQECDAVQTEEISSPSQLPLGHGLRD